MTTKTPKTKGHCNVRTCRAVLPCWEHCQDSFDGLHEPDMASAFVGDGADVGVVDFNCRHCGQSGSLKVRPEDVVFS